MATLDAVDQSWGYLSPVTAKHLGIRVVCDYLSHDASKNWTAWQIRAYHAQGIGVVLNWESQPGRPLMGVAAGAADAWAAVQLADVLVAEVGKPEQPIAIVFSCDRDTNPSQYPVIDGYYAAAGQVCAAHGYLTGAYGEADLIEHLHDKGLTTVEWQTLAWSRGRISRQADLYQYRIDTTVGGSSVDLNEIQHVAELGAWWPPGQYPSTAPAAPEIPAPAPTVLEDVMTVVIIHGDKNGSGGMGVIDSAGVAHIKTHDEWVVLESVIEQMPPAKRPPAVTLTATQLREL